MNAITKYLESGGTITKLPPMPAPDSGDSNKLQVRGISFVTSHDIRNYPYLKNEFSRGCFWVQPRGRSL